MGDSTIQTCKYNKQRKTVCLAYELRFPLEDNQLKAYQADEAVFNKNYKVSYPPHQRNPRQGCCKSLKSRPAKG